MLHHIDLGSNTAQCQNVNYETQINFLSACKECSSRSYKRKNYEKDIKWVCFCKVKTIQSQYYIMTTVFLYDIMLNRI